MVKRNNIMVVGAVLLILLLFSINTSFMGALVGSNTFSYSVDFDRPEDFQPAFIGSDVFGVSPASFNCQLLEDYRAPEPKESCWTTSLTFQDKTTSLIYGKYTTLNDYLAVTWTTNTDFDDGELDQETSNYQFELYNEDFLDIAIIEEDQVLGLNKPATQRLIIKQELANDLPGGYIITKSHRLSNDVPTIEKVEVTFEKGINTYELDLDTAELGGMDLRVRPYVIIFGQEMPLEKFVELSYNILPKVEDVDTSVDCSSSACPSGFTCESMQSSGDEVNICVKGSKASELSLFFAGIGLNNMLVIAIVAIIIGGVFLGKKKKRQ